MTTAPRYREENGRSFVDIRVKSVRNLFDGRDPAPFRERDLDDDAADYITLAVEELGAKAKLALVVCLAEAPPPDVTPEVIRSAILGHFTADRDKLDRKLREHFRRGQAFLLMGLLVLGVFLSLAEATTHLEEGGFREILREGLVIIGWVAMWRPIELLLYDWWPLLAQRRLRDRILSAEISVRIDETPRA